MWKVTIKGILAHKIRFLLTGVAVILGVSFIAGTLVLTATINKTFDGLFTNIYAHTDAAVLLGDERPLAERTDRLVGLHVAVATGTESERLHGNLLS